MLRSRTAPGLIKEFCSDARILITLRPPVAMMHSYHKEVLRNHWEDITDFHAAVAASGDRDKGLRLPPGTPVPQSLTFQLAVQTDAGAFLAEVWQEFFEK